MPTADCRFDARSATFAALSLAALMFMPLLNGLAAKPEWLHWSWVDSASTALAALITTSTIGASLWLAARHSRRLVDIVLAVWISAASMFAVGGLAKVDLLAAWLNEWRKYSPWILASSGLTVISLLGFLIIYPGESNRSRLQRLVILFWPISLLMAFHLVRAPWIMTPVKAPVPPRIQVHYEGIRDVVLLFDEWSPDYVYGGRARDLSRWPHIEQLVRSGSVYLDAHLEGGRTAVAIPNLFGTGSDVSGNLVHALQERGKSVRVWGWYHDYCRGIAVMADRCQSTSIYNVRTLYAHSMHPVYAWWTNLVLLPTVAPFRWLKDPADVAFHRQTLKAMQLWLNEQLYDLRADVVYAHVNVPHVPLLQTTPTPFVVDEAGYLSQFDFIDQVLEQVLNHQERPTRLIVLSDHNWRQQFESNQHDHVVLIQYPLGMQVESRWDSGRHDARQLVWSALLSGM